MNFKSRKLRQTESCFNIFLFLIGKEALSSFGGGGKQRTDLKSVLRYMVTQQCVILAYHS